MIRDCPKNQTIGDNLIRAWSIINSPKYKKILCSISGGSDSDLVLDIVWKCDKDNKVDYVWFDTGLEYQATKEHLKELEKKYSIQIIPYKAIKPIPLSCREDGEPFMSKFASEQIRRLQNHGFKFQDKAYEELIEEYPNIISSIRWWCNKYEPHTSKFNIARNKYLKEFLVENPPNFKISNKCCKYAKKDIVHLAIKENDYDMSIFGVRKAEGGARAVQKSCFNEKGNGFAYYRPIFWYKDSDKKDYENHFGIIHSRCYSEYGLDRTGCAGCPYGKNFEFELDVIQKYEPKLYKAVNNIFKNSYEYTRKYKEFRKEMEEKSKT